MANLLIEHEGVKGKGLKSIGKQGRAILTIVLYVWMRFKGMEIPIKKEKKLHLSLKKTDKQ